MARHIATEKAIPEIDWPEPCDLEPAAGFVAALAVGTPDAEVKGWRWTE